MCMTYAKENDDFIRKVSVWCRRAPDPELEVRSECDLNVLHGWWLVRELVCSGTMYHFQRVRGTGIQR